MDIYAIIIGKQQIFRGTKKQCEEYLAHMTAAQQKAAKIEFFDKIYW